MTVLTRQQLQRALLQDVSTKGDGRTVYGITVPFDREAQVNDGWGPYTEVFRRGSFSKTIRESANRIKLCVNHDKLRRLPIGRATLLREDAAGLYGEFRVSQTHEGDEALTLIRDGVADAFSVGCVPVKEREPRRGFIERTEVKLNEVSVVAFPAYEDALIGGLRHADGIDSEEYERLVALLREQPELAKVFLRAAPALTTAEVPVEPGLIDTAIASPQETPDGEPSPVPEAGDTPQPEPPADAGTPEDEPDGQSTRDTEAPADRSATDYQPAQRAPMSPERRQAQMGMVRALLAQTSKE